MLAIIIYNDGAFMVLFVDFGVSLDFRDTLLLRLTLYLIFLFQRCFSKMAASTWL